jgi:hypothetical protein
LKQRLYVCAIDASKAFDKVNRLNLWNKLIDRKINPVIIIALINYYNQSQSIIENNNEISKLFKTTLGVRQGGTISPKLFSIYIDELIKQVESSDAGVKINKRKLDIVVYADDILLMSTTKKGLQEQINITQQFGETNEISYNPSKTILMVFNKKTTRTAQEMRSDSWQENVKLNGTNIEQVSQMKYLGVQISEDDKNVEHINKRKRAAFTALMKLKTLGIIDRNLHPTMKGQLYKTYIRPVLFYGLENFFLTKRDRLRIKRIEGNIVKTILNIPNRCRTSNLFYALKIEPTSQRIDILKTEFYKNLLKNQYTRKVIDSCKRLELKNDICNEMETILQNEALDPLLDQIEQCESFKLIAKAEINANTKNNPTVTELHQIFNSKKREEIPDKITQLIRFDA